ncbi:MAG: NADH-quinone oxidoreductase subunit J [Elusimicrobia bacterium]|nr:NADH-quinone oxidoreductase subunit J [Elusimicrobiota bacterium]
MVFKNLAMCAAGAAAVLFSGLMIRQRSLYVGAVCLLAVLLQTAVFFFLSQAPLLAFLQIMVHAGAVMVLIVIAIMASSSSLEEAGGIWARLSIPWPLAALGLLIPFLQVAYLMLRDGMAPFGAIPSYSVQSRLGAVLFGSYAPATEAVGLLLFVSALALVNGRR